MRFISCTANHVRRHLHASASEKVRWGILSAGKISSDFAQAVKITEGASVAAVAARSKSSAEAFADRHEIATAYGSYSDLLEDPNVDVVYVGSVADQHKKLATQSLLAGKPTVVEKPFTLSYDDTKSLIDLAERRQTFLMEGMWTRCFPAMRTVRDMVESGQIGKVVAVQGDFGWSTKDCGPKDRIWHPESGGMTLDIGMYMAQLGQIAFPDADVEQVQAMGSTSRGVDHTVVANLLYRNPNDATGMLQFFITGEANTEERVVIQGTTGRIVIDPPAHVPTTVRLVTDHGRGVSTEEEFNYPLPDDSYTTWNYPGSIGFTHQISAVGDALRNGEKECRHFTHEDSLQVAFILDSIREQVTEQASSEDELRSNEKKAM